MNYAHKGSFEKGYNKIVSKAEHPEMKGMEFGLVSVAAGDKLQFTYGQEAVFVLLSGAIVFEWDNNSEEVARRDCFHEGATLLHVPADTVVTITCKSENAEIAVTRVENSRRFPARLLKPEDCLCSNEERGAGLMNECSTRLVRTFFDRSTCPDTNFFIGEVVHYPGKWSSYPPHKHVEPELYFYKFLPENGYGLAEYGDGAFKVRNNDLMGMPENVTHSQAAAPGYAEYYLWCIRLQDEVALETNVVKEHEWVAQPSAKYFPEL